MAPTKKSKKADVTAVVQFGWIIKRHIFPMKQKVSIISKVEDGEIICCCDPAVYHQWVDHMYHVQEQGRDNKLLYWQFSKFCKCCDMCEPGLIHCYPKLCLSGYKTPTASVSSYLLCRLWQAIKQKIVSKVTVENPPDYSCDDSLGCLDIFKHCYDVN